MKKIIFVLLICLLLTGCASSSTPAAKGDVLTVGDGSTSKTYTVESLKSLPSTQAAFNEVNYIGVSLVALLKDAGIDASKVKSVKVVASDGYSMDYGPDLFMREDVIVAYAQANGPLTKDDGAFRMVLPGEEGKLNVRQLVEVKAAP
jgi:hypothetical protein